MLNSWITLLSLMFLINTSCTSLKPLSTQEQFEQTQRIKLAEKEYFGDKEIKMGLALSGGGTRSAAFNIGLMAGLSEGNQLEKFNYISSVSGGSYAAYWYFTRYFYSKLGKEAEDAEDFFKYEEECKNKSCRFQAGLKNNPALLRTTSQYGNESIVDAALRQWIVPPIDMIAGSILPHFIFELTRLDRFMQKNLNFVPEMYQASIERNYGLYPAQNNHKGVLGKEYSNLDNPLWFLMDPLFYIEDKMDNFGQYGMFPLFFAAEPMLISRRAKDLSFNDLNSRLWQDKQMPIWITNTTVDLNNHFFRWQNFIGNPPSMSDSVFEFTPFYYGNSYLGYSSIDKYPDSISKAVQLSAAAVDSANPHNDFGDFLFSLLGGSIGDYAKHNDGNVYLTDGGHSENLGTYSLIKREVPIIVISDAELTEDGMPDGLILIRKQLLKEKVGKKLVLYDAKGEPVLYYHQDENYPPDERKKAKLLLRHHDCHSEQNPNQLLAEEEPLPTVLVGKICEMKIGSDPDRCSQDEKEISTVFYVKARAIYKNFIKGRYLFNNFPDKDRGNCEIDESGCYPEAVNKYLDEGNLKTTDSCFTEDFPGTPTKDILFKSYQFEANSAFGRHIGKVLANKLKECGENLEKCMPKRD